ncbi:MAG: class I SAM-dependent methyltransferase [Alphaproteobacteria bacterium]|nr:class I SAM-dependent methyltransferase [Alphaproteobacteria bacterium]NNF24396.1 class I SAM-dependent methyltransferase [Paracoccaceae bacterium]
MQNVAKFWDGIAEGYAKSPIADMEAYTYTLERTKSHLAATDRVLELGSGTGSTALLLAPGVAHITASDISGEMIRIGQEKARDQGGDNIDFVRGDLMGDPLGEGPYDAILAFNVLHLIEDQPEALERIRSLLKPGGLFISKTICRPDRGSGFGRQNLKFWLMMRLALPLMQLFGKAPYVRVGRIAELDHLVTGSGFKIIETGNHPASPPSRYIVARKR